MTQLPLEFGNLPPHLFHLRWTFRRGHELLCSHCLAKTFPIRFPLFCACGFFRTLFVQRGDAFLAYCNKLLTLIELYPHWDSLWSDSCLLQNFWTALTSGVSSSPNVCNAVSNFCAAVATSLGDRRGRVSGTLGWLGCGRMWAIGGFVGAILRCAFGHRIDGGRGPRICCSHQSFGPSRPVHPLRTIVWHTGAQKNTETNCHFFFKDTTMLKTQYSHTIDAVGPELWRQSRILKRFP